MSRFVESDTPDIVARDPLIVSKNYKDSWEERKQYGMPLLPLFTLIKRLLLPVIHRIFYHFAYTRRLPTASCSQT